MQPAPAVSVTCRDRGAWRTATATLHGAALASAVAWGLSWLALPGGAVAGAAALAFVGAAAWHRHRAERAAPTLSWDGTCWRLDGVAASAGGVVVTVDLGLWLLLRFESVEGPATWCVLSEAGVGPAWRSLRIALFASAPALDDRVAM